MKRGGIMKQIFKPQTIKYIWMVLLTALIIKVIWFIIALVFLPTSGIEHIEEQGGKPLYYRVKLSPNKAPPPPVTKKKQTVVIGGDIKDIKLLAIYNSSDTTIVTVEFGGKTRVLSRGDKVKGFALQSATKDWAIFLKQRKTYKITLDKSKSSDRMITTSTKVATPKTKSTKPEGEIVDGGKLKIIDKSLIEHFASNLNEVNKNIGVRTIKGADGKIGFGISFIRRGSPFAKLGVRRGDIIKSVNGKKIDSYNAAFGVYKNIANITNLTMVIERNKEEMELEYEVN